MDAIRRTYHGRNETTYDPQIPPNDDEYAILLDMVKGFTRQEVSA